MDQMNDRLRAFTDEVSKQVRDNREVAVGVGAAIAAYGAYKALSSKSSHYKSKPGSLDLGGGSIERTKIGSKFNDYSASYGTNAGDGITDRSKTTELVTSARLLYIGSTIRTLHIQTCRWRMPQTVLHSFAPDITPCTEQTRVRRRKSRHD